MRKIAQWTPIVASRPFTKTSSAPAGRPPSSVRIAKQTKQILFTLKYFNVGLRNMGNL